jgi:hypothetical protein
LPVAAGGDKLRAAESEARKGEIMKPRKILFMVASIMGAISALPGFPGLAMAAETLTVSISLDIPPYVIKSASEGLEVDIVRGALSGQQLSFVQMPYADLQTAIQQKKADVSIGVQPTDKSVFYSHSLIAFVNLAIAKKSDHLKIDSIAALKGHKCSPGRMPIWSSAISSRACSRRERHTAPTISKLRTRKIRSADSGKGTTSSLSSTAAS